MTRPAMLFAAGFGTRMGDLTRTRPKPLIEVAGVTLLDRTLALAEAAGLGPVVVNAHYLADQVTAHLAGRDVTVLVETPDILDTGGGLKAALPKLGQGPVVTSNTDAIWAGENPFQAVLSHWEPARMDALLLCVPVASCIGRAGGGDFSRDAEGRLHRTGDLVFGGVQILKTESVAAIPERVFSLNVVWNRLAAEGRLFGCVYSGRWCDVGRPEGIGLAENLLAEGSAT